ncbi:MAG: MlaD family protein [Planctomycetota bacterium]
MAKKANPTLIGAFVVGAVAFSVGAVLAFGSGLYLEEHDQAVAFFGSSVDGLDVGAPVKYRGVGVGTVTDIGAVWDNRSETIRIPVELTFTGESFEGQDDLFRGLDPDDFLDHLIDLGLRAELKQSSFVTGKLFVSLDFQPDTPVELVGGSPLPEVPTTPGRFEAIVQSLEELPLNELIDGGVDTVDSIGRLASDPRIGEVLSDLSRLLKTLEAEIPPLSASAQETMAEAQTLMRTADAELQAVSVDLRKLLQTTEAGVDPTVTAAIAALGRTEEAAAGVAELVQPESHLVDRLALLLEELSGAARSLRALTSYLERHPEALISGKRP